MRSRLPALIATILLISTAAFYSCQKEPKEKINITVSSKDPKSLSTSLRVWHGTRTQGTPPSQTGGGLQLDNSNTDPVKAFAGRYAIIQPQLLSGSSVDGYYVKLNGASEYFKVDYTKPRNINGRLIRPQHKSNPFLGRMDSTGGGNVDSSIVIVLPTNIQVPDTLCITYWAYDNMGNVSNPVNVCIIVTSLGPDANSGWMSGSWKFTAAWENNEPHDTIVYNRWSTDGDKNGYYCNNGVLEWTDNVPGQTFLATDSVFYRKANLTLAANGGQKYEYDASWKDVDMGVGSCSHIVFGPTQDEAELITGAWSYNSATHKITLIFEFDDMGVPVEEAWEYDVIKVNNNHFIMVDNWDPSDPYFMRMEK